MSTALQQPFVDLFTPGEIVAAYPLAFIFPWEFVAMHKTLNLLYQFWLHTQV